MKHAAKARSEETPAQTSAVAIISYDEKPGIQALANKAPDLPPKPMRHRTVARDHEYVRLGTQSLLAGIDLMTGVVPVGSAGFGPHPGKSLSSHTP